MTQTFAFPAGADKEHRDFIVAQLQIFASLAPRSRDRGENLAAALPLGNDIDLFVGIAVELYGFVFHHLRIGDDAAGAALAKSAFFQPQRFRYACD